MSEHTPGPWEPVRSLTCGHLRAGHNYSDDPRKEWIDADLNLIAAAPELLHALEQLVESVEYVDKGVYDLDDARAAIAKAKGVTLA